MTSKEEYQSGTRKNTLDRNKLPGLSFFSQLPRQSESPVQACELGEILKRHTDGWSTSSTSEDSEQDVNETRSSQIVVPPLEDVFMESVEGDEREEVIKLIANQEQSSKALTDSEQDDAISQHNDSLSTASGFEDSEHDVQIESKETSQPSFKNVPPDNWTLEQLFDCINYVVNGNNKVSLLQDDSPESSLSSADYTQDYSLTELEAYKEKFKPPSDEENVFTYPCVDPGYIQETDVQLRNRDFRPLLPKNAKGSRTVKVSLYGHQYEVDVPDNTDVSLWQELGDRYLNENNTCHTSSKNVPEKTMESAQDEKLTESNNLIVEHQESSHPSKRTKQISARTRLQSTESSKSSGYSSYSETTTQPKDLCSGKSTVKEKESCTLTAITGVRKSTRRRGRPRKNAQLDKEGVVLRSWKIERKKPGPRGPRDQPNNTIHLWEFLRNLLLEDDKYRDVICWVDQTKGIFRIIDTKEISRLWGQKKKRQKMNFDHLSKALRYDRDKKQNIGKRPEGYPKLHFAFGEKSFGWQIEKND